MVLAISFILAEEQRQYLLSLVRRGVVAARAITRAHVLLQCGKGDGAETIARRLGLCADTVYCILQRFEEGGIERALFDAPRPGQPRHFSDQQIQQIAALACSKPPEGRAHWTLDLLQEEVVKRNIAPSISRQTVMRFLHNHNLRPWREKNVVHRRNYPEISRAHERDTYAL